MKIKHFFKKTNKRIAFVMCLFILVYRRCIKARKEQYQKIVILNYLMQTLNSKLI